MQYFSALPSFKFLQIFLLLFIFKLLAHSQEFGEYLLTGDFEIIRVDDFENIYTVDSRNQLKKYNREGQLLFNNSYNALGDISEIDVRNPQKLMIFFKDYQSIQFVDNTLSKIETLNLESLGYWNISAVSLAPDNQIWIYDPISFKLIKIDSKGNKLYSSNEQYFGVLDNELYIRMIVNQEYTICYSDTEYLLFSAFGKYLSSEKSLNQGMNLSGDYLFEMHGNHIKKRKLGKAVFESPELFYTHDKALKDFQIISEKILYLLDSKGIIRLKLNE